MEVDPAGISDYKAEARISIAPRVTTAAVRRLELAMHVQVAEGSGFPHFARRARFLQRRSYGEPPVRLVSLATIPQRVATRELAGQIA